MNISKIAAGEIYRIKQNSALQIFDYLQTHSTISSVLNDPNERKKNYKPKLICAVASVDAAVDLISNVDRMAKTASEEIDGWIKQKKPAIRYYSSVIQLEDPIVRLSIRIAEMARKLPYNEIIDHLIRTDAQLGENSYGPAEFNDTICFVHELKEAERKGLIDLESPDMVRLSRLSGCSYRLQAFSGGASIQKNVGDLCVLVYAVPANVQVAPIARRKIRSDAGQYTTIVSSRSWMLSRYSDNK